MGDKYPNFATLSKNALPGRDYRIILERASTDRVAIIAPHGGSIERRTSDFARAIAADYYPYYLFEGLDQMAVSMNCTSRPIDSTNPNAWNLLNQ